jgi:hypothetical protein
MIDTPEEVSERRKKTQRRAKMTNTFSFDFETFTDRLPIRELAQSGRTSLNTASCQRHAMHRKVGFFDCLKHG